MRFDSIFSTLLETPFADDRPLIPQAEIEQALDTIEQASVDLQSAILLQQTDLLLRQATPHLQARDAAAIAALTWNAATALQPPIFSVWQLGWQVGGAHMIREMQAAARDTFSLSPPPHLPTSPPPHHFASPVDLAQLATLQPSTIVNTPAEQAVLRRTSQLSGNFANDQLARLKLDLISAISPDADGKVISRRELELRIQQGLGVGKNRAEMIARTELTHAYNSSRVETALQSDLVTHFRFLAIGDRRTTDICRSRNGLIVPRDQVGSFQPPLHVRCRSTLSPVMPSVNPKHQDWIDDPARNLDNRDLAPLPKGWSTPDSPLPKPPATPTKILNPATVAVPRATTIGIKTQYNPIALKDLTSDQFVEFKLNQQKLELQNNPDEPWNQSLKQSGLGKTQHQNAIINAVNNLDVVPTDEALAGLKLTKKVQAQIEANRAALEQRLAFNGSIQDAIDHPLVTPQEAAGWQHRLTRDQAVGYAQGSFTGNLEFYHGNAQTVTDSMLANGIDPNLNTRGMYGRGGYLATSKEVAENYASGSAANYKDGEAGLITTRVKIKNPYLATAAEIQRFGEQFGEIADLLESNMVDAGAVTDFLRARGHDGIYIKDKGYLITFAKEQTVIVEAESIAKSSDRMAKIETFWSSKNTTMDEELVSAASPAFKALAAARMSSPRAALSSGVGSDRLAQDVEVSHPLAQQGRATIGEKAAADLEAKLAGETTKLRNLRSQLKAFEPEFNRLFDEDPTAAFSSEVGKQVAKLETKIAQEQTKLEIKAMTKVRDQLIAESGISRLEAEALVSNKEIKILKSATKEIPEDELRSHLADFFQMTGGRGSYAVNKIKVTETRAWMGYDGELNLGYNSDSEKVSTLWHELGHAVENTSRTTRSQLGSWIEKRATGEKTSLASLTGISSYGDDEIALPDAFIHPYVGKFNDHGSTEVLSMGIQHFSSVEDMLKLYRADREHFWLTIGAIRFDYL
jgi:SPP1 gp7 family putative phage head morphogenesis protein